MPAFRKAPRTGRCLEVVTSMRPFADNSHRFLRGQNAGNRLLSDEPYQLEMQTKKAEMEERGTAGRALSLPA